MSYRLVKIAKELNVGTSTIVDFLKGKGFEIDNKPTSKISEEMHFELLKEFSNSMQVKEKADQLVIGTRFGSKPEEKGPAPLKPFTTTKTEEEPAAEEEVLPEEEQKEETPVIEEATEEKEKPGLKVVGKIDLDAGKKKAKPCLLYTSDAADD